MRNPFNQKSLEEGKYLQYISETPTFESKPEKYIKEIKTRKEIDRLLEELKKKEGDENSSSDFVGGSNL